MSIPSKLPLPTQDTPPPPSAKEHTKLEGTTNRVFLNTKHLNAFSNLVQSRDFSPQWVRLQACKLICLLQTTSRLSGDKAATPSEPGASESGEQNLVNPSKNPDLIAVNTPSSPQTDANEPFSKDADELERTTDPVMGFARFDIQKTLPAEALLELRQMLEAKARAAEKALLKQAAPTPNVNGPYTAQETDALLSAPTQPPRKQPREIAVNVHRPHRH